ncbi:MAG: radical SAM protein [Candidatus Omnitrophica bacterium]|nr:radical SAM protein [Candidatus Omnitrophota bacterium]
MPDICFWHKCNNYCLFCSNPDGDWKEDKYDYLHLSQRLLSLQGKIKDITVTGGEPTIHPDFLRILAFLRRRLPQVSLILLSNGRRFFYPSFTKKCLEFDNILNIAISLHGYNAQTHDRITQVEGSFEQTIKGIKNILKYKSKNQGLELRIIITGFTASYVHKILRLIHTDFSGVKRVVLVFMEIEGKAEEGIKSAGITYKEWNNYWPRLGSIIKDFREIRFYHFPLCTIEPKLWKHMWRTLPESEIAFPPRCKICWCRGYCLGVHKGYLKRMGNSEFLPPRRLTLKGSDNPCHPIIDARD